MLCKKLRSAHSKLPFEKVLKTFDMDPETKADKDLMNQKNFEDSVELIEACPDFTDTFRILSKFLKSKNNKFPK